MLADPATQQTRPDGGRLVPGLLLLGGAEGGMHEDDAALLAAHGYAALALAYYGLPGLPATLQNIALEYFEAALTFLQRHPHVRGDRFAVMGASKGGEAALLVAASPPLEAPMTANRSPRTCGWRCRKVRAASKYSSAIFCRVAGRPGSP